jgi:hypothetical protein
MIAPVCNTVCGSSSTGGGAASSVAKISNGFTPQLIPNGDVTTLVLLPIEEVDVGAALTADGESSSIIVNRTGVYEVMHSASWSGVEGALVEGASSFILVNGVPVDFGTGNPGSFADVSYSFSMLLNLTAGDVVQLVAQHQSDAPVNLLARLWLEQVT